VVTLGRLGLTLTVVGLAMPSPPKIVCREVDGPDVSRRSAMPSSCDSSQDKQTRQCQGRSQSHESGAVDAAISQLRHGDKYVNLLPAESAMFADRATIDVTPASDDDINSRYSRGEVRIVTEQARYPLTAIPGMVDGGDYNLNPEFQRRHRWNNARKSRLIESFIMNVPIPPIFLYEAKFSFYEVMDGLQRLTAIRDFYHDIYHLEGLQEWSDLNGRKYSQLPLDIRKGIDRRYLSSIILLHETAKTDDEAQRLKQLVFERINSGGERLTAQESRNAIYPGPMNELCIELSSNPNLRALWHISVDHPRDGDGTAWENSLYREMGDVELVLRFFAYRQQLAHQERRTLRDYLDEYQKQGNLLPPEEIGKLGQIFKSTVKLVRDVFGDRALYMYKQSVRKKWRYTRPTLTVYDPMMWAFSQYLEQANELQTRKLSATKLYEEMFMEHADSFSGRTAEHPDIRIRNELFRALIDKILACPIDNHDETAEFPNETSDDEELFGLLVTQELEESGRGKPSDGGA
jgi:Protein of unknown function DUF262